MSEQNTRQLRLEAMRAQRMQASNSSAPGDIKQNSRGAGRLGAALPQGRSALVKFLLPLSRQISKILYQPAPGAPLVPGTDVPEPNLIELISLLEARAQQTGGKGANIAKRVLEFLTKGDAPGETTVKGVKVKRLQSLLQLLSKAASMSAQAGGGRQQQMGGRPGTQAAAQKLVSAFGQLKNQLSDINQRLDKIETDHH